MIIRNLTTEEFITRAKLVHGNKYDYSKTTYVASRFKVNIKCPVHGVFSQTPNSHLKGCGCSECGKQLHSDMVTKSTKLKRVDVSNIPVPVGSKAVPLYGGKYALVDEEDFERVSNYNWCLIKGYAITKINGKGVSMSRLVMNITNPKIFVDHKFHNILDNRKSQLRVCTPFQNSINSKSTSGSSSKYKGVSWFKRDKKWFSSIKHEGITKYLGSFHSEEEAAKAYDKKAKELFGEFAYLNFK